LDHHREIIEIVAPTLRNENRVQWSPFMPICPACGQVNSTLVTAYHPERHSVEFSCERSFGVAHGCGFKGEQSVLGGKAKVQWKVDWALRWLALGVDYELYGKDLIDSARLSGQIVRVLGGNPPLGFAFEMFLDEEGHKVSKSVGRGVSVDQWQRYAPIEVLRYFLILNPRRARKLFLEAIPQYVDEYLDDLRAWGTQTDEERRQSRLEFVLQPDSVRSFKSELSYGLIMNLVSALGTSDPALIWSYITHHDPAIEADQDTKTLAGTLMQCALNFYHDFIEPYKRGYAPSAEEQRQIDEIVQFLSDHTGASAEEIEREIYEVGRRHYDKPGKIFPLLYKVLLGQKQGPRLGVFIKLATPQRIVKLLQEVSQAPSV
jgi:lysyl-tRNA synthetase, class I